MEPAEYARSFALETTHWWFRAKRALVASLLARHGGSLRRVLDVGCGTGAMLRDLSARISVAVGLDAEPLALAYCRRRGLGRLAAGSAVALPFGDGTFDACLCLDVLYHRGVASDARALAECRRVLRPGGLLVVTDSALAWLRSDHDEAVHGARRYTRGALLALVRDAGLVPVFTSYACCLVLPAVAAVRLLGRRRRRPGGPASDVHVVPRPLNAALLGVQAVERALLRLGPLPIGSSVVCVARKPAA